MSEMNITNRIDSYITNFSMPWDEKKAPTAATVGGVTCYRVKRLPLG